MKDLFALYRQSLAGLRLLVAATLVLGLGYPLLVLGIGRVLDPWRADGSMLTVDGSHTTDASHAVGSALLGQAVAGPDAAKYFLPRPSATGGSAYNPEATAASNLGPDNPTLVARIERRRAAVAAREDVSPAQVPPDAVTASASGLDPDISPAYAAIQVPRVARANGLSEAAVRALVADHTQDRLLGFLGEPRVDVLRLDLAVRRAAGSS